MKTNRKSEYPISDLILHRWSPRAMSGELLSSDEIMPLFEAARWAPSSYNGQPWRFIYAKKESRYWEKFYSLLIEFNQKWCKNASHLVIIISSNVFEHNQKPAQTHSFDTGAAWQNLAIEGSKRGLVVHGMQGFDYKRAKEMLTLQENWNVEAMCAIGKPGEKKDLFEAAREKENPSDRKPLSDLVFEGEFQ